MKTQLSLSSVLLSGFAATLAMTIFTFMAPLMGFEMDIPKMLANTMGTPVIIGWAAHFMVGIVLAIFYAGLFLSFTAREPNFRTGALFGILPWLIAQIMVMPMMSIMNGGSFFSGLFSGSIVIAMASLVGHLIYGAVLGGIYKPKTISNAVTA